MKYLLVDNGSLRPESVLNLRRVARDLSVETGLEVLPASLLHSSKVPAGQLEGEPAVNLERRLRLSLEEGIRNFTIIPFFFGPTGAITDYLPERLAFRREKHGDFRVERTPFLYSESASGNARLANILAANVRQIINYQQWNRPRVVLVDHGSPSRAVNKVRNAMARELEETLGTEVESVDPASMERREGREYAFNEPLLENILDLDPWRSSKVIVAMLFLSPGRHAGPGGDVARICSEAKVRNPELRTCMTGLVGDHPEIIPLLKQRMEEERVAL